MKPHEINIPHDHLGIPKHFDPDHYLDSVEQMICCDEIETALYMLSHMPGYYRDNPPERALEIKRKLYKQLMSITDYANDPGETKEQAESGGVELKDHWKHPHYHPRGEIMTSLCKTLNEAGYYAEIHEFGPAMGWLPAALEDLKIEHSYNGYDIKGNKKQEHLINSDLKKRTVFCSFEVIEHLWNPDDIYHCYAKTGIDADYIAIGCPQYTLYGGLPGWDYRELGHLRTYTPMELLDFCQKHWHGYDWQFHSSNMMLMYGKKKKQGT